MAKNRSLRAVCYRLDRIDQHIEQLIDQRGTVSVLEVGCGLGLPMLELKKRFRDRIRLTGINRDAKFNDPKRALWEGIKQFRFLPWEYFTYESRFGFPNYVNCDASLDLPFSDNTFDFVYSIATTFFLHDKIHFLEEVNRILRHQSTARIHFCHSAIENGTYPGSPEPPFDNLCEIRGQNGEPEDTISYLQSFKGIQFKRRSENHPHYLELEKINGLLDLGLELKESHWLSDINPDWIAYARGVYSRR